MPVSRILIPLLCICVALAVATGCNGAGPTATSATAGPTLSPCSGCTPLPTATPSSGAPAATATPYQPLVAADTWNYSCTSGAATKIISANGSSFNDQLTLPIALLPGVMSITAVESNDSLGNTSVSQWNLGASTTTVSPAGLEYGPTVISSGSTPYAGPVIGTITTTYVTTQASRVEPLQTFNNVVEFQATNNAPVSPALTIVDTWAVLGVGPVEIDLPDATPGQTCGLTSYTLH